MKKRQNLIFTVMVLLCLVVFSPLPADAAGDSYQDLYIIGVMQPFNTTDIPGHIDFPYYPERMQEILTQNNYVIVPIDTDMITDLKIFPYSSLRPDKPFTKDQIAKICKQYRLDGLLAGNLSQMAKYGVPQFLSSMQQKWKFTLEGILYDGKSGDVLWSDTVWRDDSIDQGKDAPPVKKQILTFTLSAIDELGNSFINKIGAKPRDNEAPSITVTVPKESQGIKTLCVLLQGNITDSSKVDSLIVNGVDYGIWPQKTLQMSYPVEYPPGRVGEKLTLEVTARDIYGNTATKEMTLARKNPIKAVVIKCNADSFVINKGSTGGVYPELAFIAYSINDFRDPLTGVTMYEAVPLGPVVVTKCDKNTSVCQFIKDRVNLSNRIKVNDIVQ
ncbi:MAG: hypothetical protein ABIH00_02975 [Armatimonadota bacterium]